MNPADAILIVFLLLFALGGTLRGAFREGVILLASGAGFWVAVWKAHAVSSWAIGFISWLDALVFVLAFFIVYNVVAGAGRWALGFILGAMDIDASLHLLLRLSGGVLGLVRGIVVVGLLAFLMPLVPLGPKAVQPISQSLLLTPVRTSASVLLKWVAGLSPETESLYPDVKRRFGAVFGTGGWIDQTANRTPDHEGNQEP